MSKFKNINLENILDQIDLQFKAEDINKFCTDDDVAKIIKKSIEGEGELDKVFIDNKEAIDIEKLLLISWIRGKDKIEQIEKELSNRQLTNYERLELKRELRDNERYLMIIKQLTKGMDIYIVTAMASSGIIKEIKVLYSKELIHKENLKKKEKENKKIFEELNQINSEEDEENMGMSYLIQCLELEDFSLVLPEDIARAVSYRIEHNTYMLCKDEIEKAKKDEENAIDDDEYMKLEKYIRENALVPETVKSIKELLKYIDLSKLLLISIYRFEDVLENEKRLGYEISKDEAIFIRLMATQVLPYIEKNEVIVKDDKEYTYSDVEKLINRINEEKGEYISKSTIEELRKKLLNGGDIVDIDGENVEHLYKIPFTEKELKEIMKISKENFAYGFTRIDPKETQILEIAKQYPDNWSNELTNFLFENDKLSIPTMLELFYNGIISAEFFKEFSEENDISSEINLQKINEQYLAIKEQKDPEQEKLQKLNEMINLYKILNLDEKSEEELQEISDNLMYEIAENFEDESDILFYYRKGLITISTLVEWSGEEILKSLYNESEVKLEEIEKLYTDGKITQDFIEKIVLGIETDYSTLITYMNKGYVSENKIIDMYMNGKIFDVDFEQLTREGRISISSFKEATFKRTQDKLEKTANIKIEPTLVNIPDKKIKINLVDEDDSIHNKYSSSGKTKTLIDPNARYEFLELLGAKKANAIIPDEENAFYNYEFFVIPNKEGKLDLNSVVIAERFYEDKEQRDEFAVDNATYFFQYKDLMVNSNLTKKEMTQQRDNVVFTANHRAGSWAVSVLYRIAQTMASSNFKEYPKGDKRAGRVIDELLKIYSQEELGKILDMTGRIDDTGEFIYEQVNGYGKRNANTQEVSEGIEI